MTTESTLNKPRKIISENLIMKIMPNVSNFCWSFAFKAVAQPQCCHQGYSYVYEEYDLMCVCKQSDGQPLNTIVN
jgi:hypothetical protein